MPEEIKKPITDKPRQGDIETALRFGAAVGQCRSPIDDSPGQISVSDEGTPYVMVPDGYSVRSLEDLLPFPTRKRAKVVVTDTAGFIGYLKRHGLNEESVIYADIDSRTNKCSLLAVIDDNTPGGPMWRDHRCQFSPRLSVEFDRWKGKDKAPFSQVEFATFLEENLPDIATVPGMPTGAEMLQLALAFEANGQKRVKSVANLQSGGVRFEFVDDEDKDTRTSMEAFKRFTIGIPVFDGSTSAYPIEARLKYREKDGKLTFWFELIRVDRVFKAAVNDALEEINQAVALPVISGNPGL